MTATRFEIENGTGRDIAVKSFHTQEIISIPTGKRKNLYHTYGDISVFSGENVLVYKSMSPLQFRNTDWIDRKQFFLKPTLTVCLYLNANENIYVIPKRGSVRSSHGAQLKGFPVKPFKLSFDQSNGI